MSDVEQPDYQLILSKKNLELRQYSSMILAEIKVSGPRKPAIQEGFRILADYIFGNNAAKIKMAMTAPVMQEQDGGQWKIRFVMPNKYKLETIPKPNAPEIMLVASPSRRFAVVRFSGLVHEANLNQRIQELNAYIVAEQLHPVGGPILAFYNPPWTLPFLRRNEVMIEVRSDQ